MRKRVLLVAIGLGKGAASASPFASHRPVNANIAVIRPSMPSSIILSGHSSAVESAVHRLTRSFAQRHRPAQTLLDLVAIDEIRSAA